MPSTLEKHQFAVLIIFIPLVFKMAMLPSLMFQTSGSDMWLSVTILVSMEIVQLSLILAIQKMGGIDGLKKAVGIHWTRLILLPLVFVFLTKSLVFFNEIVNYASSFLFYNVEDWSIKIALLIAIGYLALKGTKAIGRISELSLVFLPFILIIGLSFGKVDLHFEYVLPFFEDGAAPVFDGIWKYIFYAFDFSPFLFIGIAEKKKSPPPMDKGLNLNNNRRKKAFPWFTVGSVAAIAGVAATYLLFIASYGDASYLVDNAFARLASFNVVTTEIGSIDWPAVIFWLVMAIVCISLKLAGIGFVGETFGIRKHYSVLGSVAALWALSSFVLKNVTQGIVFLESAWRFAVFGTEIFVTLTVFFLLFAKKAAERGKKKREEKNAA